ncbi:MAG: ferric reductase-like transmembrane domain-containing protein [Candidatus Limnocylindrales bacterium]
MKPDNLPSTKQRLNDWPAPVPGHASPLAGGSATPQTSPAGSPSSARIWGPSAPQVSRPATHPTWRPLTPLAGAAATLPAGGAATLPAGRGPVSPLATGAAAAPRPQSRTGSIYRGLPVPVKIAGWMAFAVTVGAVLGATGPTAVERIREVAAIQPGLLAWYSVRALGFLAYFVLAASVLYGLLLSTKILDTIAHRPVSFALHKDLAIVALILATLHGALLVFDQSFDFTPRSVIVPFASPYSPITVGIGQLTFYASFVVTASFYVRRHIGQRAWRLLHYVTFLAFIGATFHGIASGSDSGSGWAFWVYLVPTTLSSFLLTYRIVVSIATRVGRSRDRRARIPAMLGPVRGPLDRPGATPGGF